MMELSGCQWITVYIMYIQYPIQVALKSTWPQGGRDKMLRTLALSYHMCTEPTDTV